jgi:hypothetical protein
MTDDLIERMARAYYESAPFKWEDLHTGHHKRIIKDMRAALAAIPFDPETQVIVDRARFDELEQAAFCAGYIPTEAGE